MPSWASSACRGLRPAPADARADQVAASWREPAPPQARLRAVIGQPAHSTLMLTGNRPRPAASAGELGCAEAGAGERVAP